MQPNRLKGLYENRLPPNDLISRVRVVREQNRVTVRPWRRIAAPHQLPPPGDDWDVWGFVGGRYSGKTRSGAEAVLEHLNELGSIARVGIGAPTIGDVRDVCAEGESGLITIGGQGPGAEFPIYNRSLLEARHKKGGYVKFMGSEKPNRWNGPQWTMVWADELALWNQDSWEQLQFGVRLGPHPKIIFTATPKSRKFIKELMDDPLVRITRGTMYDNPAANKRFVQRIERRYKGTRLGRQEIMGEYIDDVEGAMWQRGWIDNNRIWEKGLAELQRIVIPVDPSGGKKANNNQTGIGAIGKGYDGEWYVLSARGYSLSPYGWANMALNTLDTFMGEVIIAEVNFGGDMVESTIRNIRPNAPIKTVHASRGKAIRAEPVALLYEQGRVHHVGTWPDAEDQMCAFPVENELDDLVDVIVWGISELMDEEEQTVWTAA